MRFPFWRQRDEELNEEIDNHLKMAAQERIERGESVEDANASARRDLGNIGLIKEVTRAMWIPLWLERLKQDITYGFRVLFKSPGFTVVAVLTLALGIGANTALFSVADEVLLKSLPVKNPEQLALFSWTSGERLMGDGFWPGVNVNKNTGAHRSQSFSYLTFNQFRSHTKTVSDVFAFTSMFRLNGIDQDTESPSVQMVSGNYYDGLGITAAAGRLMTDEDDNDSAAPVIVISHRYWEQGFGSSPSAIGKTVTMGGVLFTIIGVTPGRFAGTLEVGDCPDMTIALSMGSRIGNIGPKFTDTMKQQPWVWPLMIMARTRPEASYDEVKSELQDAFSASSLEGWTSNPGNAAQEHRGAIPDSPRLQISAGSKGLMESRRELSGLVKIMMMIVGIVLLIVCSNIANLLLARSAARGKEIAVRMALGARRGRLIRQLLTESVMLSLMGAAAGALFALWGKDLFLAWINRISPTTIIEPHIDLRVLGFTAAISVITGIIVGLAPAVRATRIDLTEAMNGGPRSGRSRSFVGKTLLIAQVAMSIVLLTGAGLFVRTLINLQRTDVGFNTRNLLVFRVIPVQRNREQRKRIPELLQQACDRIQSIPGVVAATSSQWPLLAHDLPMPYIWVPGHTKEPGESPTLFEQKVLPNFFDTMGMQVVMGRNLTAKDGVEWNGHGPYRAVINETLARKYFATVNPIGKKFGMTKNPVTTFMSENELIEVVGVVRDAKFTSVRDVVPPTAFFPIEPGGVTVEVRTAVDPLSLVSPIREAVKQVNPDLVTVEFKRQADLAEITYAQESHFAFLSSLFGILALILVCIGLFGLLSYNVTNRTQEMGLRMALGAQRWEIMSMVIRETFRLVMVGVIVGVGGAFLATKWIQSLLYGVSRIDPITIAGAIVLMIVVAAIAALLPARRATKVDPIVALRYE